MKGQESIVITQVPVPSRAECKREATVMVIVSVHGREAKVILIQTALMMIMMTILRMLNLARFLHFQVHI